MDIISQKKNVSSFEIFIPDPKKRGESSSTNIFSQDDRKD
jgi:hypothetical protein